MSKFIINGERQLSGELNILGAKNSVLPLLAAAILTDEKVVLHNCPDISDVHNMLAILQSLGSVAYVKRNVSTAVQVSIQFFELHLCGPVT